MTSIIITMAGLGSRFRDAGYTVPKYEIVVHGRTLFDWSLLSLLNFYPEAGRFVFVTLKENDGSAFISNRAKELDLGEYEEVALDALTDGQATSALAGMENCPEGEPVIIYNIDTLVRPAALSPSQVPGEADGWVPCFPAAGDHWSFIRTDSSGWAVEAAEKRRISDAATIGLYWFKSINLYKSLYRKQFLDKDGREAGERYIAPMYQALIEQNGKVAISMLGLDDVHGLGKPDEVETFQQYDASAFAGTFLDPA